MSSPQQPAAAAPAPAPAAAAGAAGAPAAGAAAAGGSGLPPVLDDLTKKTIDILGRIIKKPPLTQKLLAKPPFRYLHDIFSELVRTCPFAVGLYTEAEMNSENVKEKEAKVAYLLKMIDCVGIATGLEIRANPLKIVAGLEPEETNALLQLIGKVILKKVDTTNAVAKVLAGEHQKSKGLAAPGASGTGTSSTQLAQAASTAAAPAAKPAAAAASSQPADTSKQQAKPTAVQEGARKDGSNSNIRDASAAKATPPADKPASAAPPPAAATASATAASATTTAAAAASPPQQSQPSKQAAPAASTQPPAPSAAPVSASATSNQTAASAAAAAAGLPPKPGTAATKDAGAKPPPAQAAPQAAQQQQQPPPSNLASKDTNKPGSVTEIDQSEVPVDTSDSAGSGDADGQSDPRYPQAKRRERPISARLPPPKQRPAEVASEEVPSNMPAIITDGHRKDDEDDEFVVRAVAALNAAPEASGAAPRMDEKHGGLVQKILQTKKDLEGSAAAGEEGDDQKRATTALMPSKESKPAALKEIEALRESIQMLCQNTNPLGKTMDYMQEDVDSMNKELELWRKECASFKLRLDDEMKCGGCGARNVLLWLDCAC
ncbi:microtubule-binding protein MIP-T3-domain-containing protein [Entophlyctis helioformis]|nr:microtubule-binding protein MIP-T3-domain-containing protein [Entophlyctis helioformis]